MLRLEDNSAILYGQNYFYWERQFSYLHIGLRRTKLFIYNTVNLILFLLLLINIWILYSIGEGANFDYQHWLLILAYQQTGFVFWFWLLAVCNLYLFYRLIRGRYWLEKINRKKLATMQGQHFNIANFLTPQATDVLDKAWLLAEGRKQRPLKALQVVERLLFDKNIILLVARLGLDIKAVQETFHKLVGQQLPEKNIKGISEELKQILLNSFLTASGKNKEQIEVTDIFETIIMQDAVIKEVFYDYGAEEQAVSNVVAWIEFQQKLSRQYSNYRKASYHKPKGPIDRAFLAAATPMLDRYSTDLTALARVGALPLSVGRDKELENIFRIIEGGSTSVLMVGEQGVGKGSIIEGLANRMAAEDVPKILQDKRLVSLSIPFLIAGAAEAGELQQRLLFITQETIRSGNIILYIEDIHNLVGVGAGGTENVDLSEVLVTQIRDPRVIVIGATNPAEYRQYIERGPLTEGLTKIDIGEPDRNNTIKILEANAGYLESKHKVFFTHEALAKAVDLSDRYMHEQFLPTKAVNLIEEVAAWVSARGDHKQYQKVSGEDVAELVSHKTNIPLAQMTEAESAKLLNLENIIHERIVGQEEAVKLVVAALQRARTELRDQKRPIVNLMFLGPTGVGKTELSKAVAESYFGDEKRMIRLDMSEYQTQDSVARLIGVPGSGKGGVLTEQVRNNPFSLLLLDEMEKAHPDILNIFLQVMDDGRLTDATGRTIDFTSVILVATSNAASAFIQEKVEAKISMDDIKEELVKERLKEYFRPEFLNRFDGIVVFRPLTEAEILQITGLMLKQVAKRLSLKGVNLTVTKEAEEELAQAGFDPVFGARPLRRVIQEKVDNAIAQYLLKGSINRRDTVVLRAGGVVQVDKAKSLY